MTGIRGAKLLARKAFDTLGNALLAPPRGGFGYFRNHGPRTTRRVALTFDDGPNEPSTPAVLDALGELGASATFFCVGANFRNGGAELVARAHAEGHVIGSHSMMHERAGALGVLSGAHIDDAEREVAQVIGLRPLLYRPPWGWLTPWEGLRLSRRGYTVVGWDVYTQDWQTPAPEGAAIARAARHEVQPGSIVLFHDGRTFQQRWDAPETVAAVRALVPMLRSDGYEFVTVPELLGVRAYASSL